MWRKIHRWFSCCVRTEKQDEVEKVQQQEEENNIQLVKKDTPQGLNGDGTQERQMFLRKFCAMYNRLTDDLSVNSSREREVFLRECHGMYNRVMEEVLVGSSRVSRTIGVTTSRAADVTQDPAAGLPASAPTACSAADSPHRKGSRRRRRRSRSAISRSSPSSASSSSGAATRGRRRRKPS